MWSKSQKVPFISAMVQLLSYSKGRHSFNRASLLDKKWVPGDGRFCIDLGPVQEEGVVMLLVPVWYGTQFEVWCLVATELQQLKVLKLSVL